jgi:hypothetical protein
MALGLPAPFSRVFSTVKQVDATITAWIALLEGEGARNQLRFCFLSS